MTEKRFTIKPSMIVDDVTVIIDNQKEYTFPVLDSTLNYMFCKVLNEQHETIQRLKQNIDELLSVNVEEELLKENEQLKSEIRKQSKQCTASIQRFKEENEQLKQFAQSLAEQSVNGKVMLRDGKVYDLNKILKKGDVE